MNLVRQTSIYFVANVASAAFGLLNVVIFTRLLSTADYGVYVLGSGYAAVLAALLYTWIKQVIMREEAKGDGPDMRGTILLGFLATLLLFPLIYVGASLFTDVDKLAILGTLAFTVASGFFELGQDLVRARLLALRYMVATITRAVLVSGFGIAAVLGGGGGHTLLLSSAAAYLMSAGLTLRSVWVGTRLKLRDKDLGPLFVWGFPLTISISMLSLSTSVDRFIIAGLLGTGAAGQYGASVDLVRQALIIPAISASAAFMPIAVRFLANDGAAAARAHLEDCLELLVGVVLPSAIGFALVSGHVADLVLGPDYRAVARIVMPAASIAVIFQIIVQQYVHISFLLANRNAFYLINTVATLAFGAIASAVLTHVFGVGGAAWGRVATDVFGLLNAGVLAAIAFPMPAPIGRIARVCGATAAMAVVVVGLDHLVVTDRPIVLALLIPAGAVTYLAACWVLDVASLRGKLRSVLSRLSGLRRQRA
ncbi:lipopolysaccharide biosynthesis protein [Lichenihabitans sp. PAMC28606]|uniref:lipopolysaccharide biosynthesis protein n=1 Tax=Lichenihabitans sp. PAMC28606 TaxID=2880932 RepID=UPI001D09A6BD|nr:lipopolysaccharide biosynthesis protein [Lichenihabitans sp. PAMC28606]UDL93819.1 lipopolysaccharide biosynthesis protein [Lichenihabitans sp. PAMC28606]